jgi:hypothetical protein
VFAHVGYACSGGKMPGIPHRPPSPWLFAATGQRASVAVNNGS